MATPRFGIAELVEGQAGGEVSVNELARRLEALLNPCILDRDLATPPGSPASGDLYLVATSPTGAWTGQAGKLALYLSGAWYFFALKKGVPYWIADEKIALLYDGTEFVYLTDGQAAHRHTGGSGIESWYPAGATNGQWATTVAPTANVLRAYPFEAPARAATLDRIGIHVTSAVAGNARLGIYTSTSRSNLYPSALVLDSGALSTGSTGRVAATISQALTPGRLYWFAHVGSVAPTLSGFWVDGSYPILGYGTAAPAAPQVGLSVAYTYGALPSTFPGSAAAIAAEPNVMILGRFSA